MTWSLYHIIDGGTVAYVGLSKSPEKRFYQHCRTGLARPDMDMKIVQTFDLDRYTEAAAAELADIQRILPPKNKSCKRIPLAKARRIWMDRSISEDEALAAMVGWKRYLARQTFGAKR